MNPAWLTITRGDAPLVVSLPHTGVDTAGLDHRVASDWVARCDADWWIDHLYGFARDLGATVIHTSISRTVIDVNRDPSGVSLYPGQTTTTLCPTETFEGVQLYKAGWGPDAEEITARRETFFAPYHAALSGELNRLRATAFMRCRWNWPAAAICASPRAPARRAIGRPPTTRNTPRPSRRN